MLFVCLRDRDREKNEYVYRVQATSKPVFQTCPFRPKCCCPSDSTAPSGSSKTPKSAALAALTGTLETFSPPFAAILYKIGIQHLDLLSQRYNKKRQLERMSTDDNVTPRSTRLDFTFIVPKSVSKRPDFISLTEKTESEVYTMKIALKYYILQAITIEISVLTTDLEVYYANAVNSIAKAVFLGKGHPVTNIHLAIAMLMIIHHEDLLWHLVIDANQLKKA